MKSLFPPKKREAQPRNDPGLENSRQMAMDAKESDREATVANAQTRVGKPFKELKRIGVDIIHEPSEPTVAVVDIVFVHGLTGTPASTWLHKSGMYWPAKLLSCDIPNSRILSFGYDADVVNFWNPVSQNRIGHHASNMLGDLTRRREKSGTEDRKIIFVAHSLGGLVTQECLNLSKSNAEKHLQQVSSCTIGIVFLGTPHHGADAAAWAKFGATVAKTIKHVNTDIISVLESGSEMLARVQDGFHSLLRLRRREQSEIDVTCFFEELPLPIGMVVDSQSAILPSYPSYGIHANHMDMTKFDDKDSAGYESVLGELRRWVKKLQLALGTALTQGAHDSSPAMIPIFMVPFTKDPKFIDRAKIFNLIEERTETESRIVLSGIGGVGKSQIAIEYCYRFREAHPDAHVFWVHSSTSQRLNQAYRDIARKLALPGWNDLKSDILRSVFEWFNEADNGQWLIVLDNADDRDIFFTKTTSIGADSQPTRPFIDYLPRSSQGLILITTRDARMSRQLAGTDKPIVVEAMLPSEAQDLLRSRSERPGSDNDDNSRVLVDELAYIPLAITQAAAFISENDISLADYLEILGTGDSDLQDLLDQDLGDLRRDSESQNSVIRTWKVSFDLISKQNPRAAEMLSLMAVLDRQGIPESLLQKDTDRKTDFVTARGILRKFSMISTEVGGSKYELHRLVQLATRKWLEIQGVKEMWQEKALLMLENTYPSLDFEDWTTCESLLPHAQTVTQYENLAEARPIQFANLLDNMACFDMLQGRYEIAHTWALAAFDVHKKFSNLEHPSTFRSMSTLAGVYFAQGRWGESKRLRVRVVDTSLKVLKEEHPETLRSMTALALWYSGQERLDEAERLQLRVMETSLRVLKDEHPISLQIMGDLAATYREQKRWDEAEELQVRLMEIQKRARKEEHPVTLQIMANLATTYAEQRRLDEAEKLLVQVIEIQKRVLTEKHPDTLTSIADLASLYSRHERLDEAEELLVSVIEAQEKVLKEGSPSIWHSKEKLAMTYLRQRRWDQAEKLLVLVIEAQEKVLTERSLSIWSSKEMLAEAYLGQERWDQAEELLVLVIEAQKKVLKEESPVIWSSKEMLARTYLGQKRWDQAEELLVSVIEVQGKVVTERSPFIWSSKEILTRTYLGQRRWDQAEELLVSVIEMQKGFLGEEHPLTLGSMLSLAAAYVGQSRCEEAIRWIQFVIEVRTKTLGANHPYTLKAIDALDKTTRLLESGQTVD